MEDVRSAAEAERFCQQISQICWHYLSGPGLSPAPGAPLPKEEAPALRTVNAPRRPAKSAGVETRQGKKEHAVEKATAEKAPAADDSVVPTLPQGKLQNSIRDGDAASPKPAAPVTKPAAPVTKPEPTVPKSGASGAPDPGAPKDPPR
jgi:hypothetical protein